MDDPQKLWLYYTASYQLELHISIESLFQQNKTSEVNELSKSGNEINGAPKMKPAVNNRCGDGFTR